MPPPYTHFRMIAYEVPTATRGPAQPVQAGWDPGNEWQAIGRLPVAVRGQRVANNDARIRLKRLAGVVNLAWDRLRAEGDTPTTLKVFIVPEFYFRPPDLGAGYANNTYPSAAAMEIIGALDGMFVHADFQDWLFVCGTVMWNSLADLVAGTLYYNTAIYVHGGQPQGARVIEKKLASTIDGVPQAMVPGANSQTALVMEAWANRRRRAFQHGGVQFGLEVCLDHLDAAGFRVLKQVVADWPDDVTRPSVQLHVLSAGGMDIEPGSVVAREGGYILRNDGITSPGARSEMRRVRSYAWGYVATNPWNLWGTATMDPVAPAVEVPIPAGDLRVPDPVPPLLTFAQQVVYYPHTNLP